ncbi:dnaJ homolog subfamily C member 3 [Leptopilina heterotoma]|uniref:dnaJ homolog subfamily C member 3 n=1 Tax=Leptopilina heterotoma TaxID=63436 RepID=UPI001CA95E74|nr:dnaJ homolog subfamily C member 3 [Leptopilina heterotoma]
MLNYAILLILLDIVFDAVGGISQSEIEKHLELGNEFLAQGKLEESLTNYHAAIDGDPNNYLTYFKRGTVYLALGKAKFALLDFERLLELKPDFTVARLQHGNILLKQALFDEAEHDFTNVLALEPNHHEALNGISKVDALRNQLERIEFLVSKREYSAAVELITAVIEDCPWSPYLRQLRSECNVALGEFMKAIADIRSTTKLVSDNTQGFYSLSLLLYQIGNVDEALTEIRECLKLDHEHKDCFPLYKKIKKIAATLNKAKNAREVNDHEECITLANRVLKEESKESNVRFLAMDLLCVCYTGNNEISEAISSCNDAYDIRKEPENICNRADAYLAGEMFDDAIRDFKEALDIDPNMQRAKDGLQLAQQRQKLSETRDYYKILNVPRTASKRDITKAYRKAAQKWHPDNFQDGDEKKKAEKKFIDIAAAKEVLTDDEKREKFDRGEDPLDPESAKHSGSNPFREFHQFHGSPFQFKFHFN